MTLIKRPGPAPRPGILDIAPYVPGTSKIDGIATPIKLSSNENALGCSPDAREAYAKAAQDLHLYPDGSATVLRQALAESHNLNPDRIVCGAGSDDLLMLLARAFAGPGDEVLYSQHGFLIYKLSALMCGATPVAAPETALTTQVDALLAHATERTRLVYLANPNNPTGTAISRSELIRLRDGLPPEALLVVDGAYAEFLDGDEDQTGLDLVHDHDRVVATRTFSKIHGLAALRVGWAYGSQSVAEILHRIRGPFNVNAPAIAAATAAIRDTAFATASREHNTKERARMGQALAPHNLVAAPSLGNFLLLRFGPQQGKSAADADAFLCSKGIIVRGVGAYGLPDCLRVTIGKTHENDAFLSAMSEFLAA